MMRDEEEIRQPSPWRMMVRCSCPRWAKYCPCSECWFYTILDQSEYYCTDIVEGTMNLLATSCYEWLVLSDERFGKFEVSLYNMSSKEYIKLPDLKLIKKAKTWDRFLMTAPPFTPECIVALYSPMRSGFLVWHYGKQTWMKIRYGSQIKLTHLKVCNQKIYGIVDLKYFAECEFVDDVLIITIIGPKPSYTIGGYVNVETDDGVAYGKSFRIMDDGIPFNGENERFCHNGYDFPEGYNVPYDRSIENEREQYLVGCGDDIFWIQIPKASFSNDEIESIYIYKFDRKSARWIDVTHIGDDRVFFLNETHSSSYSSTNLSLKGNCIYFLDRTSVCMYDVEKDAIHVRIPVSKPEWEDGWKSHINVLLY